MEAKELLEYLGYKAEDVKSIDDFKKNFDKEFVRSSQLGMDHELIKPLIGRYFGEQEVELKRIVKGSGIDFDFDSEDYKGAKKISDKYSLVLNKHTDGLKGKLKELEESAGKGKDEKVKEWEDKYNKLKNDYGTVESSLKGIKEEYEGYKQKAINDIKAIRINDAKKTAFGKVKIIPEASDLQKKGFYSIIEEKYNFDMDENDGFIVTSKEGKRIPSTKVASTFKSVDEILEEEAVAANIFQKNEQGGKKIQTPILNNGAVNQQIAANGQPVKRVAQRLG